MNSYILIAGDSWACGEWINHTNTHGGLRQYLQESGQQPICFSQPGLGSLTTVDALSMFIQHNRNIIKFDKIIFFQSDWVRDIRIEHLNNELYSGVFFQGYSYTKSWYISRLYYKLSELYKQTGINTILVGGQGDTIWLDSFEQEYPGVKIGCQSFTNLISNNNSRTNPPTHSVFKYGGTSTVFLTQDQLEEILQKIKDNSVSSDLEELISDMELAKVRNNLFTSNKDIFPDAMHPERQAHYKLYQYLNTNELL